MRSNYTGVLFYESVHLASLQRGDARVSPKTVEHTCDSVKEQEVKVALMSRGTIIVVANGICVVSNYD